MKRSVLLLALLVGAAALVAVLLYPKPVTDPSPAPPAAAPAPRPPPPGPRPRLIPERAPSEGQPAPPSPAGDPDPVGGRSRVHDDPAATGLSGLDLGPMDDGLREKLSVPKDPQLGYGVVIRALHPDSPAAEASLHENDVIVRADNKKVNEVADLERLVGDRDATRVTVSRDGQLFQVVLQKPFRR